MKTQKFVITFFITFILLLGSLLFFVTWVDPLKILNYPWSSPFISDRNSSYIKYTRLKEHPGFTDLVVGSSTSEVFIPSFMKERHGVEVFLAGDGGAPTALRMIYILAAIKYQPQLKRIIYVADLFEFKDPTLEDRVFYQPEMMSFLDKDTVNLNVTPDFILRIHDYISQKTIRNTFKTFSDLRHLKEGTYKSAYFPDGTTSKSMLEYDYKEPLAKRAMRSTRVFTNIYGPMEGLSPQTKTMFEKMKNIANENKVELIIVIPPWHSVFYKFYEKPLVEKGIYNAWVSYLNSLQSPYVRTVDFSYPLSLKKGILDEEVYWHGGIHFSKTSAKIIFNEIYNTESKQ